MEDILALAIVLGAVGLFVWICVKFYNRIKEEQKKKAIREEARRVRYSPSQWNEITPQQYADAIPKRRPAMKKANVSSSYANTPMTSTTSTAAVMPSDNFFDGVVTGMVVNSLVDSFSHKSEPSVGVTKSESSWGFDDSDSRKSISDSMDTSSSWSSSSSDFGSSDSGPSSDW